MSHIPLPRLPLCGISGEDDEEPEPLVDAEVLRWSPQELAACTPSHLLSSVQQGARTPPPKH